MSVLSLTAASEAFGPTLTPFATSVSVSSSLQIGFVNAPVSGACAGGVVQLEGLVLITETGAS